MVYGNQNSAPDAEVRFRAWAINRTPITNICGTRISTRLPRNATLPFLVFFDMGGIFGENYFSVFLNTFFENRKKYERIIKNSSK